MTTVRFDVPDETMRTISPTSEEFAPALRLAAAMFWYGRGDITMGTAAEIAGLDLRGFFTALSDHGQSIFNLDADDVQADLEWLATRSAHDVTSA